MGVGKKSARIKSNKNDNSNSVRHFSVLSLSLGFFFCTRERFVMIFRFCRPIITRNVIIIMSYVLVIIISKLMYLTIITMVIGKIQWPLSLCSFRLTLSLSLSPFGYVKICTKMCVCVCVVCGPCFILHCVYGKDVFRCMRHKLIVWVWFSMILMFFNI